MLNLLVYIVLYIVFEILTKYACFNKHREKNLCQKNKLEITRYNAMIEMYP